MSSRALAVFFGLRAFVRSTRGRQLWDKWKLKLPIFGPLLHKICMSRFARTFAQLIRSGVPILEVLDIVAGASGNYVVETSIKGVAEDVERGDNLSVALSKKPIFPPMTVPGLLGSPGIVAAQPLVCPPGLRCTRCDLMVSAVTDPQRERRPQWTRRFAR